MPLKSLPRRAGGDKDTGMTSGSLPYSNKGDLTTGPVAGHLVRMTVPMIWGLLAVISVQLADTYFISLLGDTDVLAGISFTFPVTMLISHLTFGVNIALSSVVSRLIGAGKHDDVRRVVLHGFFMAFGASALIALLTFVLLEPVFTLLGADERTFPAIAAYMPLWLLASVIMSVPVNANSAMRAAGDTIRPAVIMVAIAVINFILDPVMIFGWFNFPAMGVKGAALSTLIAYATGAVIALRILIVKKNLVALDGLHCAAFRDSMKRLLVIAIPAGIANIIQPASGAFILAMLASHGSTAVAAYGVVTRVEALAFLIVLALAIGMAPIIGQNWGAEKRMRVLKTINLAIGFNLLWSAFAALILAFFAESIARGFSADPKVVHYATLFFWVIPFSYGIGNLVFGWSSAYNAMGRPQWAFAMIFIKSLVFTVPAVYIGGRIGDVAGIAAAIAVANIVPGILFHMLSRRSLKTEACFDGAGAKA